MKHQTRKVLSIFFLVAGAVGFGFTAYSQTPFRPERGLAPQGPGPTECGSGKGQTPCLVIPSQRPAVSQPQGGQMLRNFVTLADLEARAHDLQFNQIPAKEKEIEGWLKREAERISRDTEEQGSRKPFFQKGRDLFGRFKDRFFGKKSPSGPQAPPKPASGEMGDALPDLSVDLLGGQLRELKSQLNQTEQGIRQEIGRLFEQQRSLPHSDQTFIASLGFHQVANCVRENLGSLRTEVPGLLNDPACQGDITKDRLLFQYFDHYSSENLLGTAESLQPLANQFRCLSEVQAIEFDDALGSCIEETEKTSLLKLTRKGGRELPPGEARCEFVEGLLHPALYASEVVMHMGYPSSFRWIEGARKEIEFCLPGSKLSSIGFWFTDPASGQLTQFDPCPAIAPDASSAVPSSVCQPGLEFISSLKAANMGMGDCPLAEFARMPVIKDIGRFCKMAMCREFDRMMRESKKALEGTLEGERRDAFGRPQDKPEDKAASTPPPKEKTPFGINIKEKGKDVCKAMGVPPQMGGGACGGVPIPEQGDHNPMTCDDPANPGTVKEYSGVLNGALCKMAYVSDATPAEADQAVERDLQEKDKKEKEQQTRDKAKEPVERQVAREGSRTQRAINSVLRAQGVNQASQNTFREAAGDVRLAQTRSRGSLEHRAKCGDADVCTRWQFDAEGNANPEINVACDGAADCRGGLAVGAAQAAAMRETYNEALGRAVSEGIDVMREMQRAFGEMGQHRGNAASREADRQLRRIGGRLQSCGEGTCSSDCTGFESKLVGTMECIRGGPRRTGGLEGRRIPGGGPDCMGAPGCEEEEAEQGSGWLGDSARLNKECFRARAMEKSPSSCWATQCPENQYASASPGGDPCSCRSHGTGGGGGGSGGGGRRGPFDVGSWCLQFPDDPQCQRGPRGGGGGGIPRGLPGGDQGPIIPPGDGPDQGN